MEIPLCAIISDVELSRMPKISKFRFALQDIYEAIFVKVGGKLFIQQVCCFSFLNLI